MSLKVSGIEHIGIAVKALETSIPIFESLLGCKCYKIEDVKSQNVRTAFFNVGGVKIELLESTNANSSVEKFINKRGEGLHHIAFKVDDTDLALNGAFKLGFDLIDIHSRTGAENLKIGFLNPKSTNSVLVEFCSE
jgi:methylmalonyl-CoA/ethylmalonyl-CoA epimerase